MAANKFATMLHKNTNKITVILIYAILEWTLIILLLLNSFFSYMIIKFADYFGLKPPCPLCSQVDHLFESVKTRSFHRDLLCKAHNIEISKMGFCLNHQKLVESQDMCEDCLSENRGVSLVNGEVNLKCSCCGVKLERNFLTSSCILIKSCFDDLGNIQNGNLVIESIDDGLDQERLDFSEKKNDLSDDDLDKERSNFSEKKNDLSDDDLDKERSFFPEKKNDVSIVSLPVSDDDLDKERLDFSEKKTDLSDVSLPISDDDEECLVLERVMKDQGVQVCLIEDSSFEHLDFIIECSGHKLIPIELIDSTTEEYGRKNHEMHENHKKNDDEVSLSSEEQVNEEVELVIENKCEEEDKFAVVDSMEMEENENGFAFYVEECHSVEDQESAKDDVQIVVESVREENDSDVPIVSEEVSQITQINETDVEVSIGNEILDIDLSVEIPCTHEEPCTSSAHFHEIDQHGPKQDQEKLVELKLLSVGFEEEHVLNKQSSISSKLDEIEEEKVLPETPTSIDSFHQLHKKLLLLEKKDFGTESLDGSVVSELEGGETVSSIEHLKSALKAERKALHALYTELEEERSASAVSANQTMAMINKLQEEKSAMQMEALQYQRMMEEQSEYDQEALQLLNELMVKREKEKQELEKELEVYRKRLSEYEAKEKSARMLKRSKDGSFARISGFSSASFSNWEDSEESSIDLNQEAKEYESFYHHQECEDHKVQVDAVQELEESFVDFEEERMSILEQLKMLEEKLLTMDDEDADNFEDVKPTEDSYRENGNHTKEISHSDGEIDEHANGFSSEMNGKIIANAKGKGLLPLFDEMSDENGDAMLNGHENGLHSNGIHEENKNLDVEDELDHLHERLQALEADREFLKNCISSLKKGDKGMDLLHEILQHLRDLKNVDLRVRNSSNGLIL